jgi:hypothetical protein
MRATEERLSKFISAVSSGHVRSPEGKALAGAEVILPTVPLKFLCSCRTITLSSAAKFRGHLQVAEVDVMSKKNRSFLLMSLIPAFLLVSVIAVVNAQTAGTPAGKPTNWSDPGTWPNRKVPAAGDKVTIESGKDVLLDVSPPAFRFDDQRQTELRKQ